jgi:hypothetical protein
LSSEREAAVIANSKAAALYYDRIFPLPGRSEDIADTYELLSRPAEQIQTLLTETPDNCRQIIQTLQRLLEKLGDDEVRQRYADRAVPKFSCPGELAMYSAAANCGIVGKMELVLSEIPPGGSKTVRRKNSHSSVLVKMINLNVVDASRASWEQILEFRDDPDARAAFCRFRDFLFESCSELSSEQLEDRINSKLDNYVTVAKKHGFSLQSAAVDVLLNSQTLIKVLCAGALGLALTKLVDGATCPQVASAMVGTALTFDVGRAAIAHKRELLEREVALRDHPANWVFMAKNELETRAQKPEPLGILSRLWSSLR